jgi:NTP pyrophosphatase (non-canonical NTP hydrolase)
MAEDFFILECIDLTRFVLYGCINQNKMNDIKEIIQELVKFRNERDWEQFHNPKDLALAINIEAAELLELFLWKNSEDANKEKIKEELADVFAFAFLLANKYDLDVKQIVFDKIKQNGEKYPVDKAKGTSKKYNEL